MRRLELRYDSLEALRADHQANLSTGRAFIQGAIGTVDREKAILEIVPPSGEGIAFDVEIVWIAPNGLGVAFLSFDAAAKARLADFMARASEGNSKEARSLEGNGHENGVESNSTERAGDTENLYRRIRSLSGSARDDLARKGMLAERIAVERAFGAAVWEALLSNPQITAPEVARIAKMGALPKPLVSVVVGNAAWLGSPEIQRALLSNPRCTGAQLDRVLGAMKAADLLKLAKHCPYRGEVRSAAERLARAKTR